MKLLKTTTLKNGRKRMDQVVESHHVQEVRRVAWDAYSQDWVDV